MLRVRSLHEYPVKSCRGVAVPELALDEKGPVNDRRFMVVDATGSFLTQREHHRLALVTCRFAEGELTLDAPGYGTLRVRVAGATATRTVVVWRYTAPANDLGEAASAWFTELLGEQAHLVGFDETGMRPASPTHAPPGTSAGRFSDGYPVLLASADSLEDLDARMGLPLPMDRFRPNVVVAGSAAWAEDSWRELRAGNVLFAVTKPCERCVVTTVDQRTGAAGKEPLATLARFRKREGAVHFGINLVHRAAGVVRVGDPVVILG